MTTIVVSKKLGVMAADSLSTGSVNAKVQKIFEVNGQLVGFCGCVTHALKFIEWLKHGTAPSYVYDKDDNTYEAVVLNSEGIFYYDKELIAMEVLDDVFSVGSGSHYALGALDAGASIRRAIEIAASRDDGTGLPVVIKKLPGKRKGRR